MDKKKSASKENKKRPWPVTVFCIIILLGGLTHFLRMSQAVAQWELLKSLPLSISPLYLALQGLIWGTAAVALSIGLWMGRPWARTWTFILVALYSLWYWIDLRWVKSREIFQTRWPFLFGITILGAALVLLTLNLPASRAYFQRKDNGR